MVERALATSLDIEKKNRLDGPKIKINFIKNAQSLGVKTFACKTEEELIAALQGAKTCKKSCLIYIPIDDEIKIPSYSWWDVPPNEVSKLNSIKNARKEYEKKLSKQRFLY